MPLKRVLFYCAIMTIYGIFYPRENDKEELPELKIGNFALPGSQRPSPGLGVGQNIIDKHQLMGFIESTFLLGNRKEFITIIPQILYGIRDDLSIIFEFPVAAQLKYKSASSSGPSDFFAQVEYALYHKNKHDSAFYVTVLGSIVFPVGNARKLPPPGFGSSSFFLGFTVNRLAIDWYWYTSYGAFLTTRHEKTKFGNYFVYQAGIGKNITYATDKWLLTWTLEMSGLYTQKSIIKNITNNNSGGNSIFFGPSLWFSTQDLIVQFVTAPVVYQHQFGTQQKDKIFISLTLGWKFH